jgi:FKBP-type peptidyl-prolyl cis-trans isomerase FkpA
MRRVSVVCLSMLSLLGGAACGSPTTDQMSATASPEKLVVTDVTVGTGDAVTTGAWVRVHYTGWLQDPAATDGKGASFDSSHTRAEPFVFQVGKQKVIRGWDEGLVGMRKGGTRRLVIPSSLGYGARGAGGAIPPNATLVFDIELLDFLPAIGP